MILALGIIYNYCKYPQSPNFNLIFFLNFIIIEQKISKGIDRNNIEEYLDNLASEVENEDLENIKTKYKNILNDINISIDFDFNEYDNYITIIKAFYRNFVK